MKSTLAKSLRKLRQTVYNSSGFIKNQEQIQKRVKFYSQERQSIRVKLVKSNRLDSNSQIIRNFSSKSIQLKGKQKITKKYKKQQFKSVQQQQIKKYKKHQQNQQNMIKQMKYPQQRQKYKQIIEQQKRRRTKLTLTPQNNPFHQTISNQVDRKSSKFQTLLIKIEDSKKPDTKSSIVQIDIQKQPKYQIELEVQNIMIKIMAYSRRKPSVNQQKFNEYTQTILQKVCYYLINLLLKNEINISFGQIQLFLNQRLNSIVPNQHRLEQNEHQTSIIEQEKQHIQNFSSIILKNRKIANKQNIQLRNNYQQSNSKSNQFIIKQSNFRQKQKQRQKKSDFNRSTTSKKTINGQQENQLNDKIKQKANQLKQLNKIIQQKEKCWAFFSQKISKAHQYLQKFQRNKQQAKQFLQSSQCQKSVQKIIQKKGEIQESLYNLTHIQVFFLNSLQKYSDPQQIKKTKQVTMDIWNHLIQNNNHMESFTQRQQSIIKFQQILFNLLSKESQIIKQFQAKTQNVKNSYSNFMQVLKQWQLEHFQIQKVAKHCFVDYYASQCIIQNYIQSLPQHLDFIQKALISYDKAIQLQGKQKICQPYINAKQLLKSIKKISDQNQLINFELHKQKRFLKVLKQII